jgi:hypothetical protein
MKLDDFTEQVEAGLGVKKPKAGKAWKGKELDPDKQLADAKKLVKGNEPTMAPAKRKPGRPPKDAPEVPHVKEVGTNGGFEKNWSAEWHDGRYVFFKDGTKVGELHGASAGKIATEA